MKILLIAPPKDDYMGVAQYPPVGLGYLATAARKEGHQVEILDCVKDRVELGAFASAVQAKDFDVAGFMVWSLALPQVRESVGIIKRLRPRATVILGGPHPSALPGKTLEFFPQADFAFRGEGEIGFPLFLAALGRGEKDFSGVPGLVWRRNSEVIANDPRMSEDLDALGFPSWDLIKPREYFMPGSLIGKDTSVLTCTRGCPYSCTFCSAWITAGKKIRKRSIQNILEEIEHLDKSYGIKIFDIPDENFTFDRDFVKGFCNAVIAHKKRFEFFLPNGIRLDSLDEEILSLMRKAGFRREVAVGIESGSERVLKLMKKSLSLGMVREKVKLLRRTGFRPIGYFILGFPGETKEDMEKTVTLAIELKLSAAAFTPFAPMPGTEATCALIERGELPQDFDFTSVTTDRVAYAPSGMTKEELDAIRKRALLRFNLRWRPLLYYFGNYNSFKFAWAKFVNLFVKGGQARGQ
ncbi:MAG: radical SAM protein [Candidatus Omnitrophica bacterium]|nr:radical SAM protein [Candidatus Omnitrophota bacterium]